MVMEFSFMSFRRMGPRSLSLSRRPGILLSCSEYFELDGPVREAVEKKCSSRAIRGGNGAEGFESAMVSRCWVVSVDCHV